MATYLLLANWTEQGIRNVKQSPSRLDASRKDWAQYGVEIKAFYLVMGRYDLVAILEAPDDESAAKAIVALGTLGNVRTETLRAFTEDEYRSLLGALP